MVKMKPEIHKSSFVAKTAVIIGDVRIGKNCGVFPNAVIRGDQNTIEIDDGSNVQDCCVIHTNKEYKVKIGKNVSIGHGAIIHGATIEDNVIIGMNATVMNGCKIRNGTIIGANALITENKRIPENSLVLGVPGKVVKQNEKFKETAILNAETYQKLSKDHLEGKYQYYNNQV
jgi:carbonic anhydrase/acetyltransferase-like protein (isoleucine patch superfamily)